MDLQTLATAAALAVLIINAIGQYFWIKFELAQIRKDSEKDDIAIEEKRMLNVKALREIYDAKIDEAKKQAQSLFDQTDGSMKSLNDKVDKIEKRLECMATKEDLIKIDKHLAELSALIIKHLSENK